MNLLRKNPIPIVRLNKSSSNSDNESVVVWEIIRPIELDERILKDYFSDAITRECQHQLSQLIEAMGIPKQYFDV